MDHGKLHGPVWKSENSEERVKIHLGVSKRKLASRMKLYSNSSVESDTDESSDSLRSIGILSMHICSAALFFVCFLRPATLAFVSSFVFPILPDQLQEKPSYRKIISPPWTHCETQGCFGDSRLNFFDCPQIWTVATIGDIFSWHIVFP